jgi:ketosteroid isomerase-like protein
MTTETEQVAAIVTAWERAVQDRDMAGTLANHSDDLVMFDVPEPIQARGLAEYRETWELFFEYSKGGPESFHLHELTYQVGTDVAFAHALLDVAEVRCRVTLGLRKSENRWLIVHEHHSSPWPDPRTTD